ncbi:30S ribosomal protein S8 [Candidatus Pacearchaeota archaeon]|nr:MAG: 30S ribosomal protein S8 [Candidatus Pacearchaeota archaeon]
MSQDIVADGLNQIMNANRVEKKKVVIKRYSKVLIGLLEMMREKGHIDYKVYDKKRLLEVEIKKLNFCKAVKPRYFVKVKDINKYLRRFLPSRNFGTLVISTNLGLLDHQEAYEKNSGGSIIAYFY